MNLAQYFVGLILIVFIIAAVVNITFVQTMITDAGYTVGDIFTSTAVVLTIILTIGYAFTGR